MSKDFENISFDMPKAQSNAIKVIGVGGGGSNAVNYMYGKQIHGVDFVICNTDAQALQSSSIPNKIQLGVHLTSGLGAGANPEIGAQAATESVQEIQQMLNIHTKMVFITAGMGGGTGTGAAPIIAKIAKDMDILTVGIVTMPFQFEGRMRIKQAQEGINELRKHVDSLIVINNNKLREVYGNLGFKAGFAKADEVLATAAKGIAEVITHHYKQNIDLHDAKTVLSNSGTAIMGSARETGVNRAKNAIISALDSPLLNDNKIAGAKNVLLLIVSGINEVTLDEIGEINDFIQEEAGNYANIIMGIGEDKSLEESISVTVVATGFNADQQGNITNTEVKKIVHTLEDNQKASYTFGDKKLEVLPSAKSSQKTNDSKNVKNIPIVFEDVIPEDISEDDFIISPISKAIENKPEQKQQISLFDLPLHSYTEIKPKEKSVQINDNKESVKQYVLNCESDDTSDKNTFNQESKKEVDASLNFEVKTKEKNDKLTENQNKEMSPLNLTIDELKKRTKERRVKLKGFNYQFNKQVNNIDEIERQPAYKRLGVDIDDEKNISKSDTALNTENNSLQSSSNSFLHDNVD
ncbi:MAG: cell division protein FtsZ [Tenacibaculum sp.]